jgi:hypothetical protein
MTSLCRPEVRQTGPFLPLSCRHPEQLRACGTLRPPARLAIFGRRQPRRSLARVQPGPESCSLGEQPGDQEDRSGHPFVGPAGRLLDEALAKAGIDHEAVYVTNVVKHFKWTASERGKRRIHKKPRYSEIQACRPWLDAVNSCLPGRDCSTGTPGKKLHCQAPTGSTGRLLARPSRNGNATSIVDSASARREISTRPNAGVHKRSEESGAVGRR